MGKIYILMAVFCLFTRVAWGGDARIRVEGVKSIFVAVATPELEQSRTALHDGKDGDVEFVVKDADVSLLYCLGVNNKVCFFSLQPGARVKVKVGTEGFEFSGDGAERNRSLCRLSEKLFYSLPNVWVNNYMSSLFCTDFLTVDPEVSGNENYVGKVQELFRQCRDEVQRWTGEQSADKRSWLNRLERMYWDAVVSTYGSLRYDRCQRPLTLLKEMDRMPFTDIPYMLSHEGKVRTYNFLLVQEELGHFSFAPDTYLAGKARCIPNRIVREEYILRELGRWVDGQEVLYLKESLNSCRREVRTPEGKRRYREITDKARLFAINDTLNGIPVAFSFENQNGEVISSAEFRGKYLYVDIWATWCAPCKQEMPYMQELEKRYGGGNVVFVSLSSDRKKDKEKWLAYLKEHHLEGVTLIASDGLSSPFISQFGVTAIPRFMLIGPDGKMISHNCWRPSDPRMKILLEKLNRAG